MSTQKPNVDDWQTQRRVNVGPALGGPSMGKQFNSIFPRIVIPVMTKEGISHALYVWNAWAAAWIYEEKKK